MSALNNQTNRNASRYFFATSEDGEQTLGLQYGTTGGSPNLSTMAVTISGSQGNGVVVNYAPVYGAQEFMFGDQAIGVYGSTYFTPSTLTTNLAGMNITSDRLPGSGIVSIESYRNNGPIGGFEFLSRGVGAELLSTNNVGIDTYISSIFRTGAIAVLGPNGTFTTGTLQASGILSVDEPTTSGGRGCFNINDMSGNASLGRWSIGTSVVPTGSNNEGSDLTVYAYADDGNFISNWMRIKRSDGSMEVQNISSVVTRGGGTSIGRVFPIVPDNTEFGADSNIVTIAGASNQAAPFVVMFSTPVANLNPSYETLLNINWANTLSTGSNHVNFKVGFSTATAYTNIIQTSFVPGSGGTWTPSDQPGPNTPIGHTNVCAVLDPDGLAANGSGFLYVMGQLSDPNAAADQIFIAKGLVTESTRNALCYRTI